MSPGTCDTCLSVRLLRNLRYFSQISHSKNIENKNGLRFMKVLSLNLLANDLSHVVLYNLDNRIFFSLLKPMTKLKRSK